MLIQILEPNFKHADERGTLVQLVREGYRQINVVESKAGTFRGGHYHKENIEVFFVISGEFIFTAEKDGEIETFKFSAGDMFLVPKAVTHSFEYTLDTVLIAMYDMGVENLDGTKDIFTKQHSNS